MQEVNRNSSSGTLEIPVSIAALVNQNSVTKILFRKFLFMHGTSSTLRYFKAEFPDLKWQSTVNCDGRVGVGVQALS